MVLDFFKKLVPKIGAQPEDETKQENTGDECALCKKPGCDKKWMGQNWHKQCLRNAKKLAKKMI